MALSLAAQSFYVQKILLVTHALNAFYVQMVKIEYRCFAIQVSFFFKNIFKCFNIINSKNIIH